MVLDFIKYYLKAGNAHSIHSPFVFELYTKVYKNYAQESIFQDIEKLRKQLKSDQRKVKIEDFGAGSKISSKPERIVASLAKTSLKSAHWAQFLYRIIHYYSYQNILELGTSLGTTTAYLASANSSAKVISLEGCAGSRDIALENFRRLGLRNIESILGNIDNTLSAALSELKKVDFVLLDANHQLEPTLRYFETIFPYLHENSVLVFDDIYWSKGMKEAWNTIVADQRVSISIDFFQMGLVFFRKGIIKQHFVLK